FSPDDAEKRCQPPTRCSRRRRRTCRRGRRRPERRRDRRGRRSKSDSDHLTLAMTNARFRVLQRSKRRGVLGAADGKKIGHPPSTLTPSTFHRRRIASTRPLKFRTASRRPPPRAPTTRQRQSWSPSQLVNVGRTHPPLGRGGARSARRTRSASSRWTPGRLLNLNQARARPCSASESRSTPSTTNGSRSVRGGPAVTGGPASIAARLRSRDSKARRIGGPVPNDGRVATVGGSPRERPRVSRRLPLNPSSRLVARLRLPGRKSRSRRFQELKPC
ncbi:MAG: hypothetical protein QOD72_1364, partial [Acidimicrobiaceae bacterium]|nr:hypothetical protein [Acidimicrobiaceae bacterium]